MPRQARSAPGGLVYHVINRGNGRRRLFNKRADYEAVQKVMLQAIERTPTRLLGWCLMPNHWHLILWPKEDGELSAFVRWLTLTHTQRWHAHRHSAGEGHVYQGRFKSFPIEKDDHLLTVLRYVGQENGDGRPFPFFISSRYHADHARNSPYRARQHPLDETNDVSSGLA